MKRRDFLATLPALAALPRSVRAQGSAEGRGTLIHAFGALPSPDRVRRVFAAGPPATVLVTVLAPEKLLGWSGAMSAEALSWLPPFLRELPVLGRLSGRGSTIPLEKLVALKPDLIVDAGTVDATYLSMAERVHRQTGIPYVLVDGRLMDSARQLRESAKLLGVAGRGEQLAQYAESVLPECRSQRRPKVYLARSADGLETALPGSVNGECIEAACAVSAVPPGRQGGLAKVSPEQLLAWSPEFIVTQDAGFFASARTDALWQRLPAVRAGHLLLAPSQPFGWLDGPPGVNRLLGVRWLYLHLHGNGSPDRRLAEVREFHRLFYGQTPGDEALARLTGSG